MNKTIDKIVELYEEGKTVLNKLTIHPSEQKEHNRALEVLMEIKDLVAVNVPKKSENVMERIKTFADACLEVTVSENMKILLDYNGIDGDMLSAQAYAKLTLISRALNEGWVPDWNDSDQYKYVPYFSDHKSGFGFSNSHYVIWIAATSCGSRLCFKSPELAEYAGKQFIEIYNQFLIIK